MCDLFDFVTKEFTEIPTKVRKANARKVKVKIKMSFDSIVQTTCRDYCHSDRQHNVFWVGRETHAHGPFDQPERPIDILLSKPRPAEGGGAPAPRHPAPTDVHGLHGLLHDIVQQGQPLAEPRRAAGAGAMSIDLKVNLST